ncbi:MAG: type II toxin-antitoxin system VapC family toxin [Chitinivibrionales bacterium]|nr:type II toxin-antitoxin system VapC family toxin [Chitinivibrionales bacterium]
MFEKKVLLDTCALLWLASEDDNLSADARTVIEQASIALVSTISAWEISLKYAQKVLKLPMEPQEWFDRVLAAHNLTISPLSNEIMFAANKLPWHHRDPADRFIIATALMEKALVITSDARFSQYGVRVIK